MYSVYISFYLVCFVLFFKLASDMSRYFRWNNSLLDKERLKSNQAGGAMNQTTKMSTWILNMDANKSELELWTIPDICHFLYTDKILWEKIYTEKRVNYNKRILRQNSVNRDLWGKANNKCVGNYTLSVGVHLVCVKI